MLKVENQIHWSEMYVYCSDIIDDLHSTMTDFLAECEHEKPLVELCTEVSSDTVDNVEAWKKGRKRLLLMDFVEYLSNSL